MTLHRRSVRACWCARNENSYPHYASLFIDNDLIVLLIVGMEKIFRCIIYRLYLDDNNNHKKRVRAIFASLVCAESGDQFIGIVPAGSIRQLTDGSGIVSDEYGYTAFGEELYSVGSTDNSFKYTGESWDANSGFYYLRARWMNPALGRFVNVDPHPGDPMAPKTLHRYMYAGMSPVSFYDPSGEFISFIIRGILAHRQITAAFYRMNPMGSLSFDIAISYTNGPLYKVRPDLFNVATKEFYEIKPVAGRLLGKKEVGNYHGLYKKLGSQWIPGLSWPNTLLYYGDRMNEPFVAGGTLYWHLNDPGLILYEVEGDLTSVLDWALVAKYGLKHLPKRKDVTLIVGVGVAALVGIKAAKDISTLITLTSKTILAGVEMMAGLQARGGFAI